MRDRSALASFLPNLKEKLMKTLKIALGYLFVGAVLSLAPIVTYAACDKYIWVQDSADCHESHMYALMENGESCNSEVCVCAYYQTSSVHREDTCDDEKFAPADGPVN
jgi:hypothetical protein